MQEEDVLPVLKFIVVEMTVTCDEPCHLQRRKEKRCSEFCLSGKIPALAMQREGLIDVY